MHRRGFLYRLLQLVAAALTSAAYPKTLLAAWPAAHFANDSFSNQFRRVFADHAMIDSNDIQLELPEIAEDGAVVPLTISSDLPDISKIYIWVENNPTPLAAELEIAPSMMLYVTARIKMAESCPVIVVAKQGNRYLRRERWVKVMQGGCGTG
jgi:sulfur-oxidizing protein SoxY